MTQHDRIIDYASRKKTITPMEAFTNLGITKLATRIGEIERKGLARFDRTRMTVPNRFGEETSFFKYTLVWKKEAEAKDDTRI